ncbi:MAG TPA: ECF-type sigma factor [Planctomycetaceae bacterium]|nr:ECF-type sigma factor [Planctomycetaceae bacterium]
MDDESVTHWIKGLKQGDREAAKQLWDRYFDSLVRVARNRLGNAPRAMADEEDVALSVFNALCVSAEQGRLEEIRDRDTLWYLLLRISRQKVVDYCRHERSLKRGSALARVDLEGILNELAGDEPPPELAAIFTDEYCRLLGLLRDDKLRQIAIRRIEGARVSEIAEELTLTERSIERKIKLIRDKWAREVADED